MTVRTLLLSIAIFMLLTGTLLQAQPAAEAADSSNPELLVVGTAHLDTQWRWTVRQSIEDYIPATFRINYKLMDLYPDYVFSFEGAFRYMLMKEYYPEDYARLKKYINSGQWRITGSWVDAVDVNIPSFESLVRHTLYGNGFFRKELGTTSRDIFLPDCFGFGYALPSIAAHCGLSSFSTQKLAWGSWVGTPFDIGIWYGVDGSSIIGAINPGAYVSEIEDDLSCDTAWLNVAMRQGEKSGLYAAYRYFGTGDTGGAPDSLSVDWLEKSIKSDGPLKVASVGADDVVDIVNAADRNKLPQYDGELIMTRHGTGCYTSQASMKRWNRKNELLADAAERASVIASQFGGMDYPREMLRDTWIRFLWHQFHDDLTGTSIPEAYEYSWNDEILCQNRFAAMLTHAVQSASEALDTRCKGIPLVVFNPLSIPREDVVEATIPHPGKNGNYVRVYGPDGKEVLSDIGAVYDDSVEIRFLASVPPVGYAVYDVRHSNKACKLQSDLKVSERQLENSRYRVKINDAGEVASIYDKMESRELLSKPVRYEFLPDKPDRWPAWEIDYDDIMSEPLDAFVGEPEIHVVEQGRTRIAVEITQKTENSVFKTIVRLSAGGAADRIDFKTDIDWFERERLLKLAVLTKTPNDTATYDLGLGIIRRGLNFEDRYEVPGQQWAELSSLDGRFGVAILNDCRYGWDHPSPEKLRLTLVHTPGISSGWDWVEDQRSQDNGHHQIQYAIYGHTGNWSDAGVVWQAARFNQPLVAFRTTAHKGNLGKTYSLVNVLDDQQTSESPNPSVMINAVKLAEESDEIVIRVRNLTGIVQENKSVSFDRNIISAREINGQEQKTGPAEIVDGNLQFSLTPFEPKAFAVTLESAKTSINRISAMPISLPYNLDGISMDDDRCDGNLDGHGFSLAGELLPDTLRYLDVPFVIGPKNPGKFNAVKCHGQKLAISGEDYNHIYLLATAVDGPANAMFSFDNNTSEITIQDYAEPIGRWNSRLSGGEMVEEPDRISPAYINRMPVAWYGSHRHTPDCKNDTYQFTYLFLTDLTLPDGAKYLTLPANDRIRIMAATFVSLPNGEVVPAQPLYDQTNNTIVRISADSSAFAGQATVSLSSPIPEADIYYTLDGTTPTEASLPYREPITVASTTTINARAIEAGFNDDYVASKKVMKMELLDASPVEGLINGVNCRYYEGEWERLPDFDTLKVVNTFIAESVSIPEVARDEDYGLVFMGYVKVPADGVYAFSINSDDGSRLFIADTLLVDNDGLHGDSEETGMIGLRTGYYPFKAIMFQCKGGEALGVSVAGPSLPKQTIPASMLYHAKGK
jgi:alpha-mannosidase